MILPAREDKYFAEFLGMVRSQNTQTRLRFYHRLSVALTCPSADYIAHIVEFFWPFVEQAMTEHSDFCIHVSEKVLPEPLLRQFPKTKIKLYEAHDKVIPDYDVGIRVWGISGVDRVIVNPATGGQFMIAGNDIYVLNKDPRGAKKDLWRVIKQLLIADFEKDGYVRWHASAVGLGGKAIAFVGRSGAGKTTMALNAVVRDAEFITNGQLIVKSNPSGTTNVRGWPDPIRVIESPSTSTKADLTLRQYFEDEREKVETGRLPLEAVVLPVIRTGTERAHEGVHIREVDAARAADTLKEQTLPYLAKWTGYEPPEGEGRNDAPPPKCRYFSLSSPYDNAARAFEELVHLVS